MNEISELKREGLSIQAIAAMTGFDRKTVRKYLLKPDGTPAYGPRPPLPSKLDQFKPYLAFVNLIWPHFDHSNWPHLKADNLYTQINSFRRAGRSEALRRGLCGAFRA